MTQPTRDGFDLVNEIDQLQQRLAALGDEQQGALRAQRDGRIRLVEAQAAVSACRAEYDIIRNRLMALMAELKALPK